MVGSTYFVSTPTNLAIAKTDEKKNKNERYCMELGFLHSNKNLGAQFHYLSTFV